MVCAWLAVDRLTRELIRKQGLFRFLSSVLVGRIPGPEEECFHPGIHVGSDVPLVVSLSRCLFDRTNLIPRHSDGIDCCMYWRQSLVNIH